VVQYYGGLCHICRHGGARQADHLIPLAERPDLAWELSNCRPAHGMPGNRCPVCGMACNQIRGGLSVERARRIIAERTAQRQRTRPQGRPKPDPAAGRPW
jgi:hypothetical protein